MECIRVELRESVLKVISWFTDECRRDRVLENDGVDRQLDIGQHVSLEVDSSRNNEEDEN